MARSAALGATFTCYQHGNSEAIQASCRQRSQHEQLLAKQRHSYSLFNIAQHPVAHIYKLRTRANSTDVYPLQIDGQASTFMMLGYQVSNALAINLRRCRFCFAFTLNSQSRKRRSRRESQGTQYSSQCSPTSRNPSGRTLIHTGFSFATVSWPRSQGFHVIMSETSTIGAACCPSCGQICRYNFFRSDDHFDLDQGDCWIGRNMLRCCSTRLLGRITWSSSPQRSCQEIRAF